MAQLRIIKKYPNRRLYDTEISSYITLEDVRQLIVEGESFEVRDAKSGEDLTRAVLLQIIAEHEQDGQPSQTRGTICFRPPGVKVKAREKSHEPFPIPACLLVG